MGADKQWSEQPDKEQYLIIQWPQLVKVVTDAVDKATSNACETLNKAQSDFLTGLNITVQGLFTDMKCHHQEQRTLMTSLERGLESMSALLRDVLAFLRDMIHLKEDSATSRMKIRASITKTRTRFLATLLTTFGAGAGGTILLQHLLGGG